MSAATDALLAGIVEEVAREAEAARDLVAARAATGQTVPLDLALAMSRLTVRLLDVLAWALAARGVIERGGAVAATEALNGSPGELAERVEARWPAPERAALARGDALWERAARLEARWRSEPAPGARAVLDRLSAALSR